MIASSDALVLPGGVAVSGCILSDDVRGESWPLNETGAFVLEQAGRPLGETVGELARASGRSRDAVRRDVLRFVWSLNALALVNLRRSGSRRRRLLDWLGLVARLVPAGAWPASVTRRRPIDTSGGVRAVATCLVALLPRMLAVAGFGFLLAIPIALPATSEHVGTAALVASATALGLGLHEAAHAALLRGVPSALVTCGRHTYVLHRRLTARRRAAVALAGPLFVAGLGAVWVAAGSAAAAPWLTAGGCPLAAHAFALTVACGDGRAACGL
jgi:hypothetical protein